MSEPNHKPASESEGTVVGSGAGLGTGIRWPDGSITCARCNYDCEWTECNACGGEGGHDGYEEDPNWYQPGEMTTCCQCNGSGGDWWCENRDCETQNIREIIKPPKVPNRYSAAKTPYNTGEPSSGFDCVSYRRCCILCEYVCENVSGKG